MAAVATLFVVNPHFSQRSSRKAGMQGINGKRPALHLTETAGRAFMRVPGYLKFFSLLFTCSSLKYEPD
jgi:hypothetical protein